MSGKVTLVSAGIGTSGLMTIDGVKALKNAEVVVYDKLLGEGVMELIPENAEKINAGKESSKHILPQDQINDIIVAKAKEGKNVVRLKGGDSYLFGRGGEEVEALVNENIPFRVISGVTSSIAAPAYAGIPVTHRACASSVHIITGHNKKGTPLNINFKACVDIGGTLVFLMGVKNLTVITEGLISAGMDKNMPCAVVERGSEPMQKKVVSTLENIAEAAKNLKTPSVIIVGEVCKYSDKFDWYSNLPLKGKKIVVARPYNRAENLVNELRENGASVVVKPCISTETIEESIYKNIEESDCIAFTSVVGVQYAFKLLYNDKKDSRIFYNKKVVAIGKKTANELMKYGLIADIVPEKHSGLELAKEIVKNGINNVLILRAEKGAEELTNYLKDNNVSYVDKAVYKTVINKTQLNENVDYVVFASPSEVEGLRENDNNYMAVCIGNKTANEAEKSGLKYIVAKDTSDSGIINAIKEDLLK